jgi:hypothetical protein
MISPACATPAIIFPSVMVRLDQLDRLRVRRARQLVKPRLDGNDIRVGFLRPISIVERPEPADNALCRLELGRAVKHWSAESVCGSVPPARQSPSARAPAPPPRGTREAPQRSYGRVRDLERDHAGSWQRRPRCPAANAGRNRPQHSSRHRHVLQIGPALRCLPLQCDNARLQVVDSRP